MELHISSDDNNFVCNVCADMKERLSNLRGYACISGYNPNNEYEYKVFHGTDDITSKFPKRITFGDMLNLMKQSKGVTLYFQREDWRGTHNFISIDDTDGRNLSIAYYHEDNRYKDGEQYFDENGIPIIDVIPYVPSYDDMFVHSWVICDFGLRENYENKEESVNNCTI